MKIIFRAVGSETDSVINNFDDYNICEDLVHLIKDSMIVGEINKQNVSFWFITGESLDMVSDVAEAIN